MWTINFDFESTTLLFCYQLGTFGDFFCTFWVLWGVLFGVEVRFKNFFGTYICRQSTLVLEVQPYLFIFWAAFHFFWPSGDIFRSVGAIFGVRIRFKKNFGTYLCSQSTLVLEEQPYLFAFTLAKFGAFFALFGPLGAIFGVEVRFKNIFGTYLHRLTTFILEV